MLWVTSPNFPSPPSLDGKPGRGKRTIQPNLYLEPDLVKASQLSQLASNSGASIQKYQLRSLSSRGLSPEYLIEQRPTDRDIIYAKLSAYAPTAHSQDTEASTPSFKPAQA
ncbi:uncharacterized protein BDV17DRAFT_42166 [Aspergillus undulatus]|uniref:uncharacterized protein n=1 Tax=Aspergillus undulatus TaxID=1810928 RepID=UPI003CCCCAC7